MVKLTFEPVNVNETVQRLMKVPGALAKATNKSITRTLRGVRQAIGRKVAERYTVGARYVSSTLSVNVKAFEGELKSKGNVIPLDKFSHTPRRRPRKPPKEGVKVTVVKGQGGYLRHAFIQPNGGIYERVGKSEYPIKIETGPSAPGMLSSPEMSTFITHRIEERFPIEFNHQAAWYLGEI